VLTINFTTVPGRQHRLVNLNAVDESGHLPFSAYHSGSCFSPPLPTHTWKPGSLAGAVTERTPYRRQNKKNLLVVPLPLKPHIIGYGSHTRASLAAVKQPNIIGIRRHTHSVLKNQAPARH